MSGIHYLHASKGVFDNCTKDQDKFGIIENTKLVNPYVVQLSQDELRAGRYSLVNCFSKIIYSFFYLF